MDEAGVDGAITNFMDDIRDVCKASGGFVLEIGVATGTGSTIAIQEGLGAHPNPLHISVDQRDYMKVKPVVRWWYFIIGDSRDSGTVDIAGLISKARLADVIFIDTDHTYEQMSAELKVWQVLAHDKTIWLFHDTYMFGNENVEMKRAIQEFAFDYGWTYVDWRTEPHGLGLMSKHKG